MPSLKSQTRSGPKVVLTVIFDAAEVQKTEEAALHELGASIAVPGFRAGKIPLEVLREKLDPAHVEERSIGLLLQGRITELLKEANAHPIIPPSARVTEKKPLTIELTIVEAPPITLPTVDAIVPKKQSLTVSDQDIESTIKRMMERFREGKSVARPAKADDRLTIRLSATDKEGVPLKELDLPSTKVLLGTDELLPGLNTVLMGAVVGAKETFTLTFPKDHPLTTWNARGITCTVEVLAMEETHVPAVTDAFVKEHLRLESTQELRDRVREGLQSKRAEQERTRREQELLTALVEKAKVTLPDELIDHELKELLEEWQHGLEERGTTIEEELKRTNRTVKQAEEELRKQAKQRWTLRLALDALLRERPTTPSDALIEATFQAWMASADPKDHASLQQQFEKKQRLYEEMKLRATTDQLLSTLLA